jgi:hypothetical protein
VGAEGAAGVAKVRGNAYLSDMSEAELKLTLFRWIDQLSGDRLRWLFRLIEKHLKQPEPAPVSYVTDLEAGYAAMAADTEREAEAEAWLEGTLNHEEL